MANLAQSEVVINDSWTQGGTYGKKRAVVDATLTLSGQGTATNKINASLFGLRTIDTVQVMRATATGAESAWYDARPSLDGTYILLATEDGTDHFVVFPTDINSVVLRLLITGHPSPN